MKIGKFIFEHNLFLAPMAGVNDFAFRYLCHKFGADLTFSEMVSAKGLIKGGKAPDKITIKPMFNNNTEPLLYKLKQEQPAAVQIFGHEPEVITEACKNSLIQKFDMIDINMGCPAPKIVKNGEGSALMNNFKLAAEIVMAAKKGSKGKPVLVKFRKGHKVDTSFEFAKEIEKAGADAISVHGRLATDGYSGTVDYECIKKIKNAVKIPVIGSGDVENIATYNKMLETGVDGVMIGRGAMGKPWIFAEILGIKLNKTENELRYECACEHTEILSKVYTDSYLTKYMRKHYLWYLKGIPNISDIKEKIVRCRSTKRALELIKLACKICD